MDNPGREAVTTRASYQPYMNPMKKPKNVQDTVIINVAAFSPIAPYTSNVSEATLFDN